MKRILIAIAATVMLASTLFAQDYIMRKQNIGAAAGWVGQELETDKYFYGLMGQPVISGDLINDDFQSGWNFNEGFWTPFIGWTSDVEENEPFIPKNPLKVNNYPNPFKDQTTISFELEEASNVSLRVYDINGTLVARLLGDEILSGDSHEETWNGKDLRGNDLASGSYLYELIVRPQGGGKTISVRNIMVMNK